MAESFTTRLIQRLQIEQKKNDHGGVYAFAQRTLAYHSNRIEGSTLTEKQTASLFDTGTLTSEDALIRAKDVEEMTGHFLMFNEMLKTYKEPLSHELMKRYHYKLKSGVLKILQTVIRSENTRTAGISYRILQLRCRRMFTRA